MGATSMRPENGGATVIGETWQTRSVGPLTFFYHEESYAHENIDAIVDRYVKALSDVSTFLDVQKSVKPISVYLCEVLETGENGQLPGSNTKLDLDNSTIWTVVTSESAGAYPEFELALLLLHQTHGPSRPEARFWEDGLAG